MIIILTFVLMGAVAFFQYRNGLFSAFTILIQVLLSGLVAFNFWEPLADILDGSFQNSKLRGYEDVIVLVSLFTVTLALLRFGTNRINPVMIDYEPIMQSAGAVLLGALTGYFVAGFLACVLQTMPWDEDFLNFEARKKDEIALRRYFPPDRVWLSMMRYASAYSLCGSPVDNAADNPYDRYPTFDREGTFEIRYWRYRRKSATRPQIPYAAEFDQELSRGTFKR